MSHSKTYFVSIKAENEPKLESIELFLGDENHRIDDAYFTGILVERRTPDANDTDGTGTSLSES